MTNPVDVAAVRADDEFVERLRPGGQTPDGDALAGALAQWAAEVDG